MLNKLLLATLGTMIVSLQTTSAAQAVGFSEFNTGSYQDAGSTIDTASVINGPVDTIEGLLYRDLKTFNPFIDADLYRISLTGGGDFSANVTFYRAATNTTDVSIDSAQLFLFDSQGKGIYGNAPTLPANNPLTPLAPGDYFLGISPSNIDPTTFTGDQLLRENFIFPNTRTLVAAKPNIGPLKDFEAGAFRDASNIPPEIRYSISLTGTGNSTTPVPEPSSALTVIALVTVGAVAKFKKKVSNFAKVFR